MSEQSKKFVALVETVHRLRAPGGCPWDRSQTHQSLRPHLIEEAYEVLDVLDDIDSEASLKNPATKDAFREELGDLLMQVVLHSEMTREVGAFDIYDVAQALNDKLISRHPHVFGDVKADSPDAALATWEARKVLEKKNKPTPTGVLSGLPKNLPGLLKAARLLQKVGSVGFEWEDVQGAFDKVKEELEELKIEVKNKAPKERLQDELGDLLFTACSVAHYLNLDPEAALRHTVDKFKRRFEFVEAELLKDGKTPAESNLKEMDALWEKAKSMEARK